MRSVLVSALRAVAAALVGAFFGFVGAMKSFAPPTALAEHHAWTMWLPAVLGRAVGASELLCAAGLIVPILWRRRQAAQRLAAWTLLANQGVAAAFHSAHGEFGALPQNALLSALLLFVALAGRPKPIGSDSPSLPRPPAA